MIAGIATSTGGGALDTQTVTTGGIGTAGAQDRERGFSAGNYGSIVDGTSDIYSGATINGFLWAENGGLPYYSLQISGATNAGWTQVVIGGTKTLTRASATFNATFGTWQWSTTDLIATQAFGTIGSVKVCVFT